MLIAVLGATGRVGTAFVGEAIQRGVSVRAVVRNPGIFKLKDDKITVEKANIFNDDELADHFKDCDAVVSCLGARNKFPACRSETFWLDSMKSIISGMRKSDVKRLVCVAAWCTKREGDTLMIVECMRPFIFGNALKSMADMETYLEEECSDIEFTVVRPPWIKNEPSSGKPVITDESPCIKRLGVFASLTYQDLTRFMLDCIERGEWKNKCVTVAVE